MYEYYCVSCGNRLRDDVKGQQILFDLNELLGFRDGKTDGPPKDMLTLVTSDQILAQAEISGIHARHGESMTIPLRLDRYMMMIGLNNQKRDPSGIGVADMQKLQYRGLKKIFQELYRGSQSEVIAEQEAEEMVGRIWNRFQYQGLSDPAEQNKLKNYSANLYVTPLFYDEGSSGKIYTLNYKKTAEQAHALPLSAQKEIRGYCPKCGKPILKGTGKYQHIRVGLIGAQSSGKTTLILSMLSELQNRRTDRKLQIHYPGDILCDYRYDAINRNSELFRKGWPPLKTAAEAENVFNASIFIESALTQRKVVLTFVDIAGEKCYDINTGTFDVDAFEKFPLINDCDIYLLCTCMDERQYGNGENAGADFLPRDAVLRIATGIYDRLQTSPPMCIVMTKADTASEAASSGIDENPFEEIKLSNAYQFRTQFDNLKMTYDAVSIDEIREPLEWCVATYEEMKDKAYLCMMPCSALGRSTQMHDDSQGDEQIEMNPEGKFAPKHVADLLEWMFMAIGISPIRVSNNMNQFFKAVPSYRERYKRSGVSTETLSNANYYDREAVGRSYLIPFVFMNPSADDVGIAFSRRSEMADRSRNRRNYVLEYLEEHHLLM